MQCVRLTKCQYEVLNIICNTYEESVSQYLQEAFVDVSPYLICSAEIRVSEWRKVGWRKKIDFAKDSKVAPRKMASPVIL
jgi:hypothetical protein